MSLNASTVSHNAHGGRFRERRSDYHTSPRLLSGCAIEDAAIAKYSQAREATGILIFSLVVANIQMRLFADSRM
jgi:hypothetical protein